MVFQASYLLALQGVFYYDWAAFLAVHQEPSSSKGDLALSQVLTGRYFHLQSDAFNCCVKGHRDVARPGS